MYYDYSGYTIAGVWVLMLLYVLGRAMWLRDWPRAKYLLKQWANPQRWIVHLIAVLYFIVAGVSQTPRIAEWSASQVAEHPEYAVSSLNYWVYAGAPVVFVVAVIAIAAWVLYKGCFPWFKYNEQERQWAWESKVKWNKSLQKVFGKRLIKDLKERKHKCLESK